MKRFITGLVFGILCISSSFANTQRYRLMFNDDPASSITIGWEQISGINQKIYFGTTDQDTLWQNYTDSIAPYRSTTYMGMNNQFAKLSGLTPNTAYYFVIKDSEGVSSRFWFKTCPNNNTEPLSFISGGDSRSGYTQRIAANKMVAKIRPHAVLFGGDLTNTPGDISTQDWLDHWQLTTTSDGQMIPTVHSFGNHEALGTGGANYIRDLFDTPLGTYYKVTFGGDLFSVYTMNGEVMPGHTIVDATIRQDQVTWLTNTIPGDTAIWKSAQYHRPMMPHNSTKQDGLEEFEDWAELFYDNGVRLVMESDAHVVKVSEECRPTPGVINTPTSTNWFATDNIPANKGLNFIGEGSWGTLRNDDKTHPTTKVSGSLYQFNWIIVTPCQIIVRTVDTQNPNSVEERKAGDKFGVSDSLKSMIWNPTESDNGRFYINRNCSTPFASFHVPTKEICAGESIGFVDQSENSPTNFKWSFGDGDSSNLQNPTHVYNTAGTYNIRLDVSNASGVDSRTINQLVVVRPNPSLVVSADTSICEGESANLFVSGADSYTWDNGLAAQTSHMVSPTFSTSYQVTGELNACTSVENISVIVNTIPSLTTSGSGTICEGESIILSASGATSFDWDNGLGSGDTHNVQPTSTQIYTVTGTTQGCSSTETVQVVVKASPILLTNSDVTICDGEDALISASGADTYVWDNGIGSGNTHTVQPITTTIYRVIGTSNGCSKEDSVQVIVGQTPVLGTSGDASICEGESTNLTVSGANDYFWDNGLGTGDTHSVSPSSTTAYSVTGNIAGCTSSDAVTVTVLTLPIVDLANFEEDSVCMTGNLISLPVGTPTGGIYNGNGVVGAEFSPNSAGTGTHIISYTYLDSEGCENLDETMIFVSECLGVIDNNQVVFNIYPNPTSDFIIIERETPSNYVDVLITDSKGNVVYKARASEFPMQVEVSDWARGSYFVHFSDSESNKVIKQIIVE
jgi:PKD repeat protein